jgi:pentatricopeptide repeat protein
MYCKCGELLKAHELFNELPFRSVVSWSALIAGYVQHGDSEQAMDCFEQMQVHGLTPDSVTLMCMLKACSSIGASVKGQEIHVDIIREGFLNENNAIGNSLVDMYVKCGMFEEAQDVFEELAIEDVVSWNALLAGYAQLGKDEIVFTLFEKMIGNTKTPNLVTFTILMNACSRTGQLEKGQSCIGIMSNMYKIIPDLDHCTCIIDLFARAGHLDKATVVIEEMPFSPSVTVWHTMLGACHKWENVMLGRFAFEHAIQLDAEDAAPYICMINIYHMTGELEDANKIEEMRVEKQAWKVVGGSSQCGILHSFSLGG